MDKLNSLIEWRWQRKAMVNLKINEVKWHLHDHSPSRREEGCWKIFEGMTQNFPVWGKNYTFKEQKSPNTVNSNKTTSSYIISKLLKIKTKGKKMKVVRKKKWYSSYRGASVRMIAVSCWKLWSVRISLVERK